MIRVEEIRARAEAAAVARHVPSLPSWVDVSDLLAVVDQLTDALTEIAEQQPKTIEWLRAHEIVFDGPLGADPKNWEHVAFSIYTDLCETDSLARSVLSRVGGGQADPCASVAADTEETAP